MIPFGIIYFTFAYFAHLHNILFVIKQPFESFGSLWPDVFTQACVVLGMYQIILMTVLGMNGFYYSFLISPLVLITYGYWYYINKRLTPLTDIGPLSFELKQEDIERLGDENVLHGIRSAYIHPGLIAPVKGDIEQDVTEQAVDDMSEEMVNLSASGSDILGV